MTWMELLRNVMLALVLIISTHIALGKFEPSRAEVVVLPQAHAAQNIDVAKTTMPLDGLKEMFEYARSGEDWGHTPVIMPPSDAMGPHEVVKDTTISPSGLGDPEESLSDMELGVSAFDGWSGTASFP